METKTYDLKIGSDSFKGFKSFEEAFPYMYKQIARRIDEHTISRSAVDFSYMVTPDGTKYFYLDACQEAKEKGLLKDGKLVEKTAGVVAAETPAA